MKHFLVLFCLAGLLFSLPTACFADNSKAMTLVYTGNMSGQIEPARF